MWCLLLLWHIDDAAVNIPDTVFALNHITCHPVLLTVQSEADVSIFITDILTIHDCHYSPLIGACTKLRALCAAMHNHHTVFLLLLFYPLFEWLSLYVYAHILPFKKTDAKIRKKIEIIAELKYQL